MTRTERQIRAARAAVAARTAYWRALRDLDPGWKVPQEAIAGAIDWHFSDREEITRAEALKLIEAIRAGE